MIKKIIEEIRASHKEPPNQLFARLVKERLEKALVSYYSDIDSKVRSLCDNEDALKLMKKVIR